MFLLDTNVVSELRRAASGKADPTVMAWAASIPTELLFISALTVFELEYGVRLKENSDPAQGSVLRLWLDTQVLPAFKDRTLAHEREERIRAALKQLPEVAAVKKRNGSKAEARASITDADARVMKMGDGGFRPAYNVQFATTCEVQVIVGMAVVNALRVSG